MMLRAVLVVASTLALAGCSRVITSRVLTGPPGPPYGGPGAVIMETAPPPANFVEVAILQAIGYGWNANLARVVESLQTQAAGLGCDAVIRVHIDQGSSQASGTGVCVRTAATWQTPAPVPQR